SHGRKICRVHRDQTRAPHEPLRVQPSLDPLNTHELTLSRGRARNRWFSDTLRPNRLRDHTNLLDTSFFHSVHDLDHDAVRYLAIGTEVQGNISMLVFEDFELVLQLGDTDRVLIKVESLILLDGQNRSHLRLDRIGGGFRQIDIHAAVKQRRLEHKDDEQHEDDIDQGDHIDLSHKPPLSRFEYHRCAPTGTGFTLIGGTAREVSNSMETVSRRNAVRRIRERK